MSRVRLPVHVGTTRETVDIDEDARVRVGVSAGDTDGLCSLGGTPTRDVDLSARRVELHAVLSVGGMERGDLHPQKVLAVGDASRQVEVNPAVILDHVVDTPDSSRGVESVLPDLEPLGARRVGASRAVDLGQVRRDGPLVRGRNRVVRVVGELRSPDDVLVPGSDLVAGLDFDHLVRGRAGGAACQRVARRVLHWIVVVRGAKADERSLVCAVDGEFLVWVLVP